MDRKDNTSNLRVASFSCYLETAEENNLLNVRVDYESTTMNGHKKGVEPNPRTVTPAISSEGRSLNSQTALLPILQRNPSQIKQKMAFGKMYFSSFGCCGRCSDKKAVNINEITKKSQPELKTRERFAFPVLDSVMENPTEIKQFEEGKVEEEQRKSLDVFGSEMTKKGDIAANLERKLSILTWDAIPKAQSHATTNIGSSIICDDMASEASSDLFEIENVSGIGYSMLTRQASDNTSCSMTPTTQYAPSEASIEWSIATASAADFSSAVSDYDEKNLHAKVVQNCHPSGLLGCKGHKAVRVAKSVYRTGEKTNHQGSGSSVAFGNSQISRRHSP